MLGSTGEPTSAFPIASGIFCLGVAIYIHLNSN